MSIQDNPVRSRKHLVAILRSLRDQSRLTQKQVSERLDWSISKIVRVENGVVGISTTDLQALLRLYQVNREDEVSRLTALARIARQRAWYTKYPHARDAGFDAYLSYESSASRISNFQSLTIPGLLQTEDYARAILLANDASHVEERLRLRLERQALLDRTDTHLHCIVDEAALRRHVGGAAVMRDQLIRTKAAAEHPRITFEIVPFTAGAHASMTGSFIILHSDEWDEDVLFREAALKTVTNHEDHGLLAGYGVRFDLLHDLALGAEQATALIDTLIKDLQDTAQAGRPG
jgi:transcriptional regulator with XRE-family HTH domain